MQRIATAAIHAERGAGAIADEVQQESSETKKACVARQLTDESERAACVAAALTQIEATEIGVRAMKVALSSFWITYAVLEKKRQGGEPITREDLLELASRGAMVATQFEALARKIREARQ